MHLEAHDHSHPHDDQADHGIFHPHVEASSGTGFFRTLGYLVIAAVIGLLAYASCFFVDETEYVYVTEFGKPIRLCIEPGFQWKRPYQSVLRLDRRLQMYGPPGSQMLTRDRPVDGGGREVGARQGTSLGGPPLTIDWFVCWRLPSQQFVQSLGIEFDSSVLKFVQSVGTVKGAQDRLRERIDSMLKAKVGHMSLSEFVSLDSKNIKLEQLNHELTEAIRRDAIEQFGIEVVDVRIKRFNHPDGVRPAIFDMIRAERLGVAEKYRAEGKSEAAKIRSQADTERAQILSKALADAERIRGEGDAEAMRIANEAHRVDPQFYQLLKTLDTYRAILNDKTTIVLSSDSPLLRLLTEGMPRLNTPPDRPSRGGPTGHDRPAAGPGESRGSGNSEDGP